MTTDFAARTVDGRRDPDVAADPRPRTAEMLLAALVVVALAETLRTLYPLGYSLVGDLGFIVTPAVLLLVFLAPALSPLLAHAGPRGALWLAAGLVIASRVMLQLTAPPTLPVAVAATVSALIGATTVLATVLETARGPLTLTVATLVGLGIDVALKGAYALWDRVWQPTLDALGVTVVVAAATLTATWAAQRRGLWLAVSTRGGPARRMFAFAVLLMPSMLLLASPAFIGASAGAGVSAAVVVPVVGVLVAAIAVALLAAAGGPGRRVGAAAGASLAVVCWALTDATGAAAMAWAIVGMGLLGVLLLAVLTPPTARPTDLTPRATYRAGALGATAGFVAMFALTLLHPMHYEMPLPFSNTLLPSIAVLLSMLALVGPRAPSHRVTVSWVVAPIGVLVAVAGGAVLWLAASAARPQPLAAADDALRVATFNVDQGAAPDGAVDFEAVADVIDALDSDLVALQEVGRGWPLSGMNDLAGWLRQTHGMHVHFAPAADHQFGNALVTRVVLDGVRTLALPKGDGSMDRSAAMATLRTPTGTVTVIAVHLQHRNTTAGIEARAAELDVVLRAWDGTPRTIVLGDFNADNRRPPGGGPKVMEGDGHANTLQPLLDAGFTTTQPTTVCTAPTSNDNCSDFVFVTADLVQDPPVEVLADQDVGDHRPVRSTVSG